MSLSLQALQERIESAKSLTSIVDTMRTLAMVNIRRAEQVMEASDDYARCIHLGLYVVLQQVARRQDFRAQFAKAGRRARGVGRTAYLVLASNQGLCGQFNERIVQYTYAKVMEEEDPSRVPIVSVGYRGAERLDALGCRVIASLDAPTSVEAISSTVRSTYIAVNEGLERTGCDRLVIVYNEPAGGRSYKENAFQLLPLDEVRWRALPEGEPPFETVPQAPGNIQDQLSYLARELLFIEVFRAITHSFAAENAARLVSMQGASDNLEEQLSALEDEYREARQESVTNEMMDMVNGVLALG